MIICAKFEDPPKNYGSLGAHDHDHDHESKRKTG